MATNRGTTRCDTSLLRFPCVPPGPASLDFSHTSIKFTLQAICCSNLVLKPRVRTATSDQIRLHLRAQSGFGCHGNYVGFCTCASGTVCQHGSSNTESCAVRQWTGDGSCPVLSCGSDLVLLNECVSCQLLCCYYRLCSDETGSWNRGSQVSKLGLNVILKNPIEKSYSCCSHYN